MFRALLIAFLALPMAASAKPYIEAAGVKNARAISDVAFSWLGRKLYDGALYTSGGAPFSWQQPMALELTYARSLSRARLVSSTVEELARLEGARADHAALSDALATCLRDVSRGDRITAVARSAASVDLFFNGAKTCTLAQPNMGHRFLNIWLAENSRSAQASRKLKGL